MPVPTAVAPSTPVDQRARSLSSNSRFRRIPQHNRKILAQRDRYGILQTGTSHLDHIGELYGLGVQSRLKVRSGLENRPTSLWIAIPLAVDTTSLEDWHMLTWVLG